MTSPTSGIAQAQAVVASARSAAALRWGSWEAAVEDLLAALPDQAAATLGLLFVDARFAAHYAAIVERVRARTAVAHLIGCSAEGVIGCGVEAEDHPGVALLTLTLPGAALTPVALPPGGTPEPSGPSLEDAETWLVFADPYSIDGQQLVRTLERRRSPLTLIGGMASDRQGAAGTAVWLDDHVQEGGAVLVGLSGVTLRTVVAQGAEPLGRPWTITDCADNMIRGIGSRPALDVLADTLAALEPETRTRAVRNLLVGLAIDEYQETHTRGDFLIRHLLGADQTSKSIAIDTIPRAGQTIQFQVRDAAAADADLRHHLAVARASLDANERVLGALVCSCNGRGQRLFGVPHHDAAAVNEMLGPVPSAGLFCAGEIGPVGGKNFLHGFTASIALLTARES